MTHDPKISVVYYHRPDHEADNTNMGRYHKVTCEGCQSMWTGIPGRGVALYVQRYHMMYPDVEDIPWPPTLMALITRRLASYAAHIPKQNWTKRLRRYSGRQG